MNSREKPFSEWSDEEKHFQPEWLDKAREEMNAAMEGMTTEERIAYIEERAAALMPERMQES